MAMSDAEKTAAAMRSAAAAEALSQLIPALMEKQPENCAGFCAAYLEDKESVEAWPCMEDIPASEYVTTYVMPVFEKLISDAACSKMEEVRSYLFQSMQEMVDEHAKPEEGKLTKEELIDALGLESTDCLKAKILYMSAEADVQGCRSVAEALVRKLWGFCCIPLTPNAANIRDDKYLMLEAIESNPHNFLCASLRLQQDHEVWALALRSSSSDFEFMAAVERLKRGGRLVASLGDRLAPEPLPSKQLQPATGWDAVAEDVVSEPSEPTPRENAADNVVPRRARGNAPRFAAEVESTPPDEGLTLQMLITPTVTGSSVLGGGEPQIPQTRPQSRAQLEFVARRAEESKVFAHQQIEAMTKIFADRLGAGSCGTVFRGTMPSGTPVAVKRLEPDPGLGAAFAPLPDNEQLHMEVVMLSRIIHPNVVPLLGLSIDGPVPCLVYALMDGGALDERLAPTSMRPPLSASQRMMILSDVSRGLAYLHTQMQFAHRNVKSANVLLERGDIARISDFGIARNVKDGDCSAKTQTHVHTQRILGTLVYMAPEYKNGELSTKVDAFSFGLVILEALMGLPASNPVQGRISLLIMFEDDLGESKALVDRLDARAGTWSAHTLDGPGAHVPKLHAMVERCLQARRKQRCEVADLVPQFEEIRRATERLRPAVPKQYRCQLTGKLMRDPVVTACGSSYERLAIYEWLSTHETDPATGATLPHKGLAPDDAMRELIDAYCIAENPLALRGMT